MAITDTVDDSKQFGVAGFLSTYLSCLHIQAKSAQIGYLCHIGANID